MQLAGNSNRQQAYTPPLLAAILMLASLRSFLVNFRTFNMKKIITLFFYVYNFSLCNSCWKFERFYRNGFYKEARKREFLVPLGIPQKILLIKIWNIKEIVLSNELKQKDKLANELPFGYV